MKNTYYSGLNWFLLMIQGILIVPWLLILHLITLLSESSKYSAEEHQSNLVNLACSSTNHSNNFSMGRDMVNAT